MKIIASFFYSGVSMFAVYNGSWILLHFLLETTDRISIWTILLMLVLQVLAIPAIFLLIFLPVYLLQKNFFLQQEPDTVYRNFLCIPMLPVVIISFLNIHQITNTDFAIVLASTLLSVQYGFYRFIKTIRIA